MTPITMLQYMWEVWVKLFTMLQDMWEVWVKFYPLFLQGLWGTLKYAFIAVLFGTLIGTVIALLHISKYRILQIIASIYTTVLRGTPLLVQLYMAYFFFPVMIPAMNSLSKATCVIIALILNSSAYVSEIIRGGINAVDKGQTEAARSLGMKSRNCMIHIVIPQAVKTILPALGNEYISMIKETSLAATLSLSELMFTKTLLQNYFLVWEPIFIIAIIYLILTMILTKVVSIVEKRLAVSD